MSPRPFALLVMLALLPLSAEAEPAADPTAQALFRKGRDLVSAGDWDEGCEQLAASLARFEAASTVLNLARCDEHFGHVASAWARYQRGLVLAHGEPGRQRRASLEKIATDGIGATEPRLPKLRIDVASPPPGLEVSEGGRPLPVGEAVPLDPGPHEVVLAAPGYQSETRNVTLEEGKLETVAIELQPNPPPPEAPAPAPAAARRSPPKPKPALKPVAPAPKPAASGSVPTWAWISGGAGIVLAGVATGFALDANAQENALRDKCGRDFVCNEDPSFDPDPVNARKNRSLGLAIGLGSAGLVAIGASLFGIVSARPSSPSVGVLASRRGVGIGLSIRE